MEVQVDIFGSMICRDVFRYMDSEKYRVNRCIGNVPITELYEPVIPINKDELENSNLGRYNKRMLKIQLSRKAVKFLKNSTSDFLILDLVDECMKRYCTGGLPKSGIAYQDEDREKIAKIFLEKEENSEKQILDPMNMDLEKVREKFEKFAEDIVRSENNPEGYDEKNIIVLENYFTENEIGNDDGVLHFHPAAYKVKEKNEFLRRLYQMLYQYIPNCRVIKLPIFTYSTQNHLRGRGPLCYTEDTYRYLARALETIFGGLQINSLENLHKEQGLQNKLFTRLMKTTVMYGIGPMKNEIKALQEQVKILEQKLEKATE